MGPSVVKIPSIETVDIEEKTLSRRTSLQRRYRVSHILSVGFLLSLFLPCFAEACGEDEKPLPGIDELLEKIRGNLRSDRYVLRNYTYNETQEIVESDKKGQPGKTETRVFEIFPSTADEITYRKLVSKDGKPVGEARLRKQDREHAERVRKYARKARKRGGAVQSELEASEGEALRKQERALDEVFQLYEFTIRGRESVEGHQTLIVDFTPRPDFKVTMKDVKPLKKISGRAWISEDDYQLVRIEAETLKSLKFGLGVIARLNKGAHLTFRRRKVNDEVWLPAEAFFQGTGRILVFKGFRFQARSEYSDYKKFSVGSSVTFPSENQ